MNTLTKPTKAAMTAIAEKMAEQWEVKFRKITTDINCAIHGLTDVLDVLEYGSVVLDLPADGDEMRFNVNSGKGYITFKADRVDSTDWWFITFKADRVDSTDWWLHAEAIGEFLYNEDGKETGHAPLDMPEELGEKIIVTI